MRRAARCCLFVLAIALPAQARGGSASRARAREVWLVDGAPLARVREGAIRKTKCGRSYAGSSRGSRWIAIDFWGQPTGVAEVARSSIYDLTGCRELEMRTLSGRDGVGIHAPEGYRPSPSFECAGSVPRAAHAASFRAVAPGASRVDVFCEGGAVWALGTGRGTTIGRWDTARRAWIMAVVPSEGDGARTKPWLVADMNGDGAPEIVIHEELEDTFHDVVWSLDPRARTWKRVVVTDGSGYA